MTRIQIEYMAYIKALLENNETGSYADMRFDDYVSANDLYTTYENKNGEELHMTLEERKELFGGYVMNSTFGRGPRRIDILRLTKKGQKIAEEAIDNYYWANISDVYGRYEDKYDVWLNY